MLYSQTLLMSDMSCVEIASPKLVVQPAGCEIHLIGGYLIGGHSADRA